ncbi:flagellar motor protein MotB [Paenibacillus physcomitrellae]|uniref:Chemotaxis protein MotA n=1 Tax=Paenibacillus physcomitrellae TaxID=1619311 RepID=A0ABQ1GGJ3_9BACL|nr:flagellar motor protein MotB [Paenibacillus physcomitrellae]GGA43352.1 chemotaxis protein MotA [Paenibacillus physcomitrellae]
MRQRQRGSRKSGSGEGKDRWMITYADLITLLLIFFVIMYAMSRLDTEKYKSVTESLQFSFHNSSGGKSVLEGNPGLTGSDIPNATDHPAASPAPSASPAPGGADSGDKAASGDPPLTERELAFRQQEEQLANLMKMIKQYVQENHLDNQIFVADKPQGIAITLSDQFLFDTGKAALKPGSGKTLSKLGSLFSNLDTKISIEGHTDNQPIVHSSQYKDNWELSGARALSVLRYFIDTMHLDANNFQYAGYADTHPAADNSTAAGRQKNRRVEITVLRQLQQ